MSTAVSTSRLVVLACGLMFVSQLANYVLAPAFPQLPKEFGAPVADVQQLIGVFLAGFALVQLIVGPISDTFGRRPAVVTGLVLFVTGSGICALATTLEVLAVGLLIQAMGAGSFPTLAQALLRDRYELRAVVGVMSVLSAVMAVTVAATPLVSSLILDNLGWRAMFEGLFILVAPLIVVIPLILPETLPREARSAIHPREIAKAYGKLLGNRPFMAFALSLGLMTGAMAAFFAGAPFVFMSDFGYTYEQFGWWFMLAFSGFVIGSIGGGRMVARFGWGMRATALGGVSLAMGGSLVGYGLSLVVPDSAEAVLFGAFLFSLGLGLALGVGRGAAMMRVTSNVGAASATINFTIGAIAATVSSIAPQFETTEHGSLFLVTSAVAALGVIAVLLAGRDPVMQPATTAAK
jgi:DHA1 family bicyclomycin/chloramphenicol resistance-like MFS transporter